MAGRRFLGLEEMCLFAFHHQTQQTAPCLTCDCSKGPVVFLSSSVCWREHWRAGVEGIAPGTSKFKKKILVRGSRAGGLLLLLGVQRDWEGWD